MAISLNEFTRELNSIKKAANDRGAFAVEYQRKRIQWPGFEKPLLKSIRARAAELKGTGKTVKQLRQDSEIRELEQELHSLDKDVEQTKIYVKSWGKPTAERTRVLETQLTAEIAKRRKELTTKLGVGNKSLPAMETLLAELKKFKNTARFKAMVNLKVEESNRWQLGIDMDINREIEAGLAGK